MKRDLIFHMYIMVIILAASVMVSSVIIGKFVGKAAEDIEEDFQQKVKHTMRPSIL